MKEQLITQLKTQITDLERFINYLQGEVSPETLACTCACPVHTNGSKNPSKRKSFRKVSVEDNAAASLGTFRKIVGLLHMYLISQMGCGTQSSQLTRRRKDSIYGWRDLRTRLDIAVEYVLETVTESIGYTVSNEPSTSSVTAKITDYNSDSDSAFSHYDPKITTAVRKHLAICIRDLMQHGTSTDVNTSSLVPFVGCFPKRSNFTDSFVHAWEIIMKYYEIKNGHMYLSSPAQKLSQSFNIDLNNSQPISSKQSLLVTVGNITAMHAPYKRSNDTCFKAFICAALK